MTEIMKTALSRMYREADFSTALDAMKKSEWEDLKEGFTKVFSEGSLRVKDDVLEGMCSLHFFDGDKSLGTTGFVSEREMTLFKGSFIALILSFMRINGNPVPENEKAFILELYEYERIGIPRNCMLVEFVKETFEIFCQAL